MTATSSSPRGESETGTAVTTFSETINSGSGMWWDRSGPSAYSEDSHLHNQREREKIRQRPSKPSGRRRRKDQQE